MTGKAMARMLKAEARLHMEKRIKATAFGRHLSAGQRTVHIISSVSALRDMKAGCPATAYNIYTSARYTLRRHGEGLQFHYLT